LRELVQQRLDVSLGGLGERQGEPEILARKLANRA
jgi:hypothetical protein